MRTADPDVLAALVEQASGAKGELRTNLIEILGIYKDPRKIPALIQMSRPFESEYVYGPIHEQLVELGAPAAEALMESVPDQCDANDWEPSGYKSWVGRALDQIGTPALPAIFAGLRSGEPCKHSSATEALLRGYMRPLEPAEDIEQDEVGVLTDPPTAPNAT